jgi:hypothetical protein
MLYSEIWRRRLVLVKTDAVCSSERQFFQEPDGAFLSQETAAFIVKCSSYPFEIPGSVTVEVTLLLLC